jgi:beta-alanine--pyruvate transaminase
VWEEALHAMRGAPHVRDIRNLGLLGAVEIASKADAPGQRARMCADYCFDDGVFLRALGDTLILSPPLIITEAQIAEIANVLTRAIAKAAN